LIRELTSRDRKDVRRAINYFKAEVESGKITENSFEEVM